MQKPKIVTQKPKVQDTAFEYDEIRFAPDFPLQIGHDCLTAGDSRNGLFHFHKVLEIGLCLQGNGVFTVEGAKFAFGPGDMMVIGPGLMHTAVSARGHDSHWVWMFLDAPGLLGSRVDDIGMLDVAPYSSTSSSVMHLCKIDHPNLHALLCEVAEESAGKEPSRDILRSLLVLVMTRLRRMSQRQPDADASPTTSGIERIIPALRMINARFRERVTVGELASACCMSERNFTTIFERIMHETPHAYLTRFRVAQSCGALAGSQRTVSEIALGCGFESLSSFNRNFRSAMGATPLEFRRKAG